MAASIEAFIQICCVELLHAGQWPLWIWRTQLSLQDWLDHRMGHC